MDYSQFSEEIQNCIEKLLARRARTGDPGYDSCQRLLKYAAEEKSALLFGLGYYYFAEYYLRESVPDKVMHCLMEGMKYFRKARLYEYMARAYNMMGAVAETQNNRVTALDYYFTSLRYAEKYGCSYVMAMTEGNIANILYYMKKYERALKRTESAIRHYGQSEWTSYSNWNIILCRTRMGLCYVQMNETAKVLDICREIEHMRHSEHGGRLPELNIAVLSAYGSLLSGDGISLKENLNLAMLLIEGDISLLENADSILDLADLLKRLGDKHKMQEFLNLLTEKGVQSYLALWLDLYPCCISCLQDEGRTDVYAPGARQYFSLYEKYQKDNMRAAYRIVELRDILRSIEREQDRMLAYQEELKITSQQDAMTGLANRTWMEEYLSERFEEAYRNGALLGVELLDIDYFKQYNDTYGHLAGDGCIEQVAAVLKEVSDGNVFCARYGGDEFMIIYSGLSQEQIAAIADKIHRKIRDLHIAHSTSLCSDTISVSQGIFCRIPSQSNREWDFSSMADMTLYEVKKAGRNHYIIRNSFPEVQLSEVSAPI